jgi:hypothetical protein
MARRNLGVSDAERALFHRGSGARGSVGAPFDLGVGVNPGLSFHSAAIPSGAAVPITSSVIMPAYDVTPIANYQFQLPPNVRVVRIDNMQFLQTWLGWVARLYHLNEQEDVGIVESDPRRAMMYHGEGNVFSIGQDSNGNTRLWNVKRTKDSTGSWTEPLFRLEHPGDRGLWILSETPPTVQVVE